MVFLFCRLISKCYCQIIMIPVLFVWGHNRFVKPKCRKDLNNSFILIVHLVMIELMIVTVLTLTYAY